MSNTKWGRRKDTNKAYPKGAVPIARSSDYGLVGPPTAKPKNKGLKFSGEDWDSDFAKFTRKYDNRIANAFSGDSEWEDMTESIGREGGGDTFDDHKTELEFYIEHPGAPGSVVDDAERLLEIYGGTRGTRITKIEPEPEYKPKISTDRPRHDALFDYKGHLWSYHFSYPNRKEAEESIDINEKYYAERGLKKRYYDIVHYPKTQSGKKSREPYIVIERGSIQ